MEVKVIRLSRDEFTRAWRAKQHIAGQAMHYGVVMSNERLNYNEEYGHEYPEHWEATKQRLENTWIKVREFNERVDVNSWNQELRGFAAQQAVENGLRGMLSARKCPEAFRHNLNMIWDHYVQNHRKPVDSGLETSVEELLNYTTVQNPAMPGRTINWLTPYAAQYLSTGRSSTGCLATPRGMTWAAIC